MFEGVKNLKFRVTIGVLESSSCKWKLVALRVRLFVTLLGSFVHGILQARILELVAMPSSRGSSRPRDQTCISGTGRQIPYHMSHQGPDPQNQRPQKLPFPATFIGLLTEVKVENWEMNSVYTPVTKDQHQNMRLASVPFKTGTHETVGQRTKGPGWGRSALSVIFVTQPDISLIKSQTILFGRRGCEMCHSADSCALDTVLPRLWAWAGGSGGLGQPATGVLLAPPATSSVREHPELPVYLMCAAWDYEKLLSTLKIIFSRPHRSFFK